MGTGKVACRRVEHVTGAGRGAISRRLWTAQSDYAEAASSPLEDGAALLDLDPVLSSAPPDDVESFELPESFEPVESLPASPESDSPLLADAPPREELEA